MVDFDIAFTAEYNINYQGMETPGSKAKVL